MMKDQKNKKNKGMKIREIARSHFLITGDNQPGMIVQLYEASMTMIKYFTIKVVNYRR